MPQADIFVFRDADGESPLMIWLDELELRDPRAHAKCLQRILVLSLLEMNCGDLLPTRYVTASVNSVLASAPLNIVFCISSKERMSFVYLTGLQKKGRFRRRRLISPFCERR